MLEIVLLFLVFVFLLLGFIFVFVPGLPGSLVAWLGMPIYLVCTQVDSPVLSWAGVGVCGVLALSAFVLDYLAASWGAKKFGGTWLGALGAFVGALSGPIIFAPFGFFLGLLVGVLVGPAIGAFVFEWFGGKDSKKSGKIAWGAFVGGALTFLFKIIVISGFFIYVLYASVAQYFA
ncbi:MAG: DUF456 domain-containing protein [Opitutales bacterium]|nr:DUF456 domain-containing protein [Opitutales bacterium]